MRVIGGEFRSRILKSVPGLETRPTPDQLREALFNVLAPRIEGPQGKNGIVFADLYAGTGAVGIEALSRGASRAIFVEQSRQAARVIQENLSSLGLNARAQVRVGRVRAMLGEIEADIVFLDPPYALETEYAAALERLGRGTPKQRPALIVVQHSAHLALKENYGTLHRTRILKQGDNCLDFYDVSRLL